MAKIKRSSAGSDRELKVAVIPFGPTTEQLAQIGERVAANSALRKFVGHSNARLLYVDLVDEADPPKAAKPVPPRRFRATFYDDKNRRTVFADGPLPDPRALTLSQSAVPPPPSQAEFEAATSIVRGERTLSAAMTGGTLQAYRPIPALHLTALPDGTFERRIAVGLLPRGAAAVHEIVSTNLATRSVTRFEGRAPDNARPTSLGRCGVPQSAGQATAAHGTAGQAWITVSRGGRTLWRFLAVRPAASSGTKGSGIELRYVDYKGKRVLYRAHVPILNVKYDNDACGPFRDWQYQEGMIDAQGTDPAPGFRLCSAPAKTILDTGSDTGNFLGVGVYVANDDEVVLVSEMEAGWYRYVSQWRLAADGTIRPRFGFAAVESQCVCNVHHHHVYWRLDFDICGAADNRVREFNDPPLAGGSKWHTTAFEVSRPRDDAHKRKWRVENAVSGETYEIVPNASDGIASAEPDAPFGRGDVWILRYRGTEIDDGVITTGPPYEADIDRWVNGESVSDADVVIWYGAHFTHDINKDGAAHPAHIVGPDLRRVKW